MYSLDEGRPKGISLYSGSAKRGFSIVYSMQHEISIVKFPIIFKGFSELELPTQNSSSFSIRKQSNSAKSTKPGREKYDILLSQASRGILDNALK